MPAARAPAHFGPLATQIAWFIRLRWIAGAGILLYVLIDAGSIAMLRAWGGPLALSVAILAYNAVLCLVLSNIARMRRGRKRPLLLLAWTQLLLDFASLTLLIIWTGGTLSPFTRLFVLHMVFASVLLPTRMAYAAAGAALAIQWTGLTMAGLLPVDRQEQILGITQALVLFLVVFLTNHITADLRREHRRVIKQNRRIQRMSQQVRRQQRAMLQHEKMVAMGQMAAGVTHEIANPLASLDSLLQLAQRKPEKLKPEMLETLREQVRRINQIIQQMKTFAHPGETDQRMLPLKDVIEQTLQLVLFDARVKRTKIERHFSPRAMSISVPAQTVQQVLVNLIINALDAMADQPEPTLTLRTDLRDDLCIIEIADNGQGIRAEYMSRLFEPFFTTKPVGKGTGLGLSISYSLIRKEGGEITVHSRVGHGTTFTIRLPATSRPSQNWEASIPPIATSEKTVP